MAKKTSIFNYKNNRFWSFFGRNPKILDLDTKMYAFQYEKQRFCNMGTNFRSTVLRFRNTDVRKTKQNNDFTKFSVDSSTFLQHWCPENKAFHKIFVRQFYVFATSRRFSFDSSTFSQHWCPENKAKQRCRKPKMCDSSMFLLPKIAPRRFLSDSSIFWTKKPENTVFSHVFAIFLMPKWRQGDFWATVLYFETKKPENTMFSPVFCNFLVETMLEHKRARKKKRRKWCARQAKLDFETFYEEPKNLASAIRVNDFTFSISKQRRFKYQKRRFRLRGVSKSSRSEVIKKSIQNEVDQSKSSELAETSENFDKIKHQKNT